MVLIELFQKNTFASDFDFIEDVKDYTIANRERPVLFGSERQHLSNKLIEHYHG